MGLWLPWPSCLQGETGWRGGGDQLRPWSKRSCGHWSIRLEAPGWWEELAVLWRSVQAQGQAFSSKANFRLVDWAGGRACFWNPLGS